MMIVAFPFAFNGKEEDQHVLQANLFIRMARMFSPPIKIVQMTDLSTCAIHGVDEVVRSANDELGQWHFKAMSEFPYDQFLRVDYDVVVLKDVSEVFEYDFDIAIAKEREGMMNNGVVFVKNKKFFDTANLEYKSHTGMDGWMDIQTAMQIAIDGAGYKVRKLDPAIYNYFYKKNTKAPNAKIVHFKGARKEFMSMYCIQDL